MFGIWFHSEPLRYFFAAIAVTIYAEIFARIKKTPTSTFLIVPMIPLIPGGVLYYTMSYALKNDWNNFVTSAFYTIKLAMALAVGIIVVSTLVRMFSAVLKFLRDKNGNKKDRKET